NLTIDNAAGVSLSSPLTVNGTLAFSGTSGKLIADPNLLSLGASATVSGASSSRYVVGAMNKSFNTGAGQSFVFPVGDSTVYAPLALANMTVGTAGNLTVNSTAGENPQIGSSGIDAAKSVNRYWTATAGGGLVANPYNLTLNFVAGDVDGSANTANFVVEKYSGGAWARPTVGTRTATSTAAAGLSAFGDFAVGEPAPSLATKIRVETAADGSGTVVPAQNVTSGNSVTLYAIARAADNSFIENVSGVWSLPSKTGGVVNGDLVAAEDGKSATFTGHVTGTATVQAASGVLVPTASGTLTVLTGPATQVRVETAANGSGTLVPAQNLTSGTALTVYAISRDAASNFVANVAADSWTMENETGGVSDSNLSPLSGTSSTLTGNSTGTGNIRASLSGLTSLDSGLISVVPALKVWSGSPVNYQWDTINSNWVGGFNVFLDGDPVQFTDTGSASSPIELVGTLSPGTVTVNASSKNYTFSGGGNLSGAASLVKDGSGTLILANSTPNNYSGITTIQNGTLQIGAGGTEGSLGAGAVSNNATLLLNRSDDLVVPGPLSGSGTLQKQGAGTVTFQSISTYTGPVTINGGQLAFENSSAATLGGNITGVGAFGKGGGGTLILAGTGNNWSGGTFVSGGTLRVGSADNTGSLPGGSVVLSAADSTLFINTSNNITINSEISGPGKLSKRSWGVLTLSASNSFEGTLTMGGTTVGSEGGVIRLLNSYALGGPGLPKTVNVIRGELDLEGGITLPASISFNTSVNRNQGGLVAFRNVTGTNVIEGNVTMDGGGGNSEMTVASGRLTLNGTVTASTTGRVLVLNGNGEGVINGAIVDSAANIPSIRMEGPGKWNLSGANSYTGSTVVSNGTLLVNGTIGSGANTVIVTGAAGVFGGNATVLDAVNVLSDGSLSPGNGGIGTLTVNNAVTLSGKTIMEINKTSLTSDLLIASGNIACDGALVVSNLSGALSAGDSFTLFAGGSYSGSFTSIVPATPGAGLAWDMNSLTVDGTLKVVAAAAPPTLGTITRTGATSFTLTGSGAANQTYYVWGSTTVATPIANWLLLGSTTSGAGGEINFVDTQATNAQQFYRMAQ
ncbi:MAG: beta strand repeat-containing protein, partial [Verrucomicrobiota bacterium]